MDKLQKWQTHAHADRLAKVSPTPSDAGVNVSNVTGTANNKALPKGTAPNTLNSDGLPVKATTPAIIGTKKPVVMGNGVVTMAGADRSRTAAKAPTSEADDRPFVPLDELGSGYRVVEHLQNHGVAVGIKNGILTVARAYVPSAKNLIAQLSGGR